MNAQAEPPNGVSGASPAQLKRAIDLRRSRLAKRLFNFGQRGSSQRRLPMAGSLLGFLALVTSGCANLVVRDAVPEPLVAEARIPGLGDVRYWGDEAPADVANELRRHLHGISKLAESPPEHGKPVVNYLALSGGGDDGVFAAGLLAGWTESGRRPRFEVVTGISAGALIAPFAFLGPAYDKQLEAMWTGHTSSDLITPQPLAVLLGGSALVDTQPLADLIAHYVDRRFLDAIAQEYRKGRLLLIGTTNLDAQRPVVWNMGEIALSSRPEAVTLFRQVLLASASLPVAFPPMHIQVEAGGKVLDELHVDGGTTRKVFVAPLQLSLHSLDPLHTAPPLHRILYRREQQAEPRVEANGGGPCRHRPKLDRFDEQKPLGGRSLPTLSPCKARGRRIQPRGDSVQLRAKAHGTFRSQLHARAVQGRLCAGRKSLEKATAGTRSQPAPSVRSSPPRRADGILLGAVTRMRRCKALLQRALVAGERKLARRATRHYLRQAEKRLC